MNALIDNADSARHANGGIFVTMERGIEFSFLSPAYPRLSARPRQALSQVEAMPSPTSDTMTDPTSFHGRSRASGQAEAGFNLMVIGAVLKVLTSMLVSVILAGCVATGPMWSGPASSESGDARIIVYRYSRILAKAGDWVPTRLEVNESTIARIPDGSFVEFQVPADEIRLSATDMINLHYDNENRMTLHEKIRSGETAYFRIVSVYGHDCGSIHHSAAVGATAMHTRYPRPDWPVTSCFQRVPEVVASKELANLRRADQAIE